MATNNFAASPADISQEWLPDGHAIFISFSLYNVVYLQEQWTLIEDYRTNCATNQTFGKFEMIIRRDPDSDLITGEAKLTRMDSLNISIWACIEINVQHRIIGEFIQISRAENVILPGGEMVVYVTDLPDINDDVFRETLSLYVSIHIEECHGLSRSARGEEVEKKWHCSKI